jgi:hypothetical protein
MTAKLTDRERWRRELSSAAPPADVMADLVFSMILSREAEFVDEAEAGICGSGPARRCSRTASVNPFTKRSNAALASAMIWNGSPAA